MPGPGGGRWYPRTLRQRLPKIGVPLSGSDPDVVLNLQAVLKRTYNAGRYAHRLDYQSPCIPKLSAEDRAWANQTIKKVTGKAQTRGQRKEK